MYICSFLFWATVPMLFFPPNFAVPMREWLGERSFLSSSFLIAMLGDVLRLMLGFHIFQRLWSWSFMYEFHHFTIWSMDESLFDISFNAYSLNVCATYMCSMFSVTIPMLLFHLFFCCSHALFHCIQVSLIIHMFMSIWYSDWFIWDRHVCVIFGLSPDLPTHS